jgi:hypothetical protein
MSNLLGVYKNSVRLVHASVKDFLLSKHGSLVHGLEGVFIEVGSANLDIARFCVRYIKSGPFNSGPVTLRETYQFQDTFEYPSASPSLTSLVDEDHESKDSSVDGDDGTVPNEVPQTTTYPLLTYCSRYWIVHARRAGNSNIALNYDEIIDFCSKSAIRNAWLESLLDGLDNTKPLILISLSKAGIDTLDWSIYRHLRTRT